jgi:hypothetical protein
MAKGDVETYYEGGVWKNKIEGNSRASNTGATKAEVQTEGRRMAIANDVEHVIRNKDGEIGQKSTYPRSRDEFPPAG